MLAAASSAQPLDAWVEVAKVAIPAGATLLVAIIVNVTQRSSNERALNAKDAEIAALKSQIELLDRLTYRNVWAHIEALNSLHGNERDELQRRIENLEPRLKSLDDLTREERENLEKQISSLRDEKKHLEELIESATASLLDPAVRVESAATARFESVGPAREGMAAVQNRRIASRPSSIASKDLAVLRRRQQELERLSPLLGACHSTYESIWRAHDRLQILGSLLAPNTESTPLGQFEEGQLPRERGRTITILMEAQETLLVILGRLERESQDLPDPQIQRIISDLINLLGDEADPELRKEIDELLTNGQYVIARRLGELHERAAAIEREAFN